MTTENISAQQLLAALKAIAERHNTIVDMSVDEEGDFIVAVGGSRIVDHCDAPDTVASVMIVAEE